MLPVVLVQSLQSHGLGGTSSSPLLLPFPSPVPNPHPHLDDLHPVPFPTPILLPILFPIPIPMIPFPSGQGRLSAGAVRGRPARRQHCPPSAERGTARN